MSDRDTLRLTGRGQGALILALLLAAFVAGYLSGPWGLVPVTDAETTGAVTSGKGDK